MNAVILDKTGALTQGEPEVVETVADGQLSEDELLALAAAAETKSEHPLAQAVVKAALARGLALPGVHHFEQDAGLPRPIERGGCNG